MVILQLLDMGIMCLVVVVVVVVELVVAPLVPLRLEARLPRSFSLLDNRGRLSSSSRGFSRH